MKIKLLVSGGDMKPGPAVAQQLGPMGINMGKVISSINEATKDFKGITVPVNLEIDPATKDFSIEVLSPPTSELIKKELGIEKGSGARMKEIVGNISLEKIISVTKTKHPNMLAKDFASALKSIIGTVQTLGILIDSKQPKEILQKIKSGEYDEEIKLQKTEADSEKQKGIDDFWNEISEKQQSDKKKSEEVAAAAEAKKAAAATEKAPSDKSKKAK